MRSADSVFIEASLPSGVIARLRGRLGGQDGLRVAPALLGGVGAGLGPIGHFTNPHRR